MHKIKMPKTKIHMLKMPKTKEHKFKICTPKMPKTNMHMSTFEFYVWKVRLDLRVVFWVGGEYLCGEVEKIKQENTHKKENTK